MFITVSSVLYNTMTFILTCTFTSVSKPKIGLRKKSLLYVLLHNMCDFVPNLRLLYSLYVSQCTNVLVNFGVNILSLKIIVVCNVLNYLFCVCWSSPLKVTSMLLASFRANIWWVFLLVFLLWCPCIYIINVFLWLCSFLG